MISNVSTYPILKIDANGNPIPDSSDDLTFRGDYQAGLNLIYSGFARPGADTADPVWQIQFHTYDANNNLTSSLWPNDPDGNASSEYAFVWDDRNTTITYS